MDVKNAILSRRSIRKFENKPIDSSKLTQLVDLARFHATGGNVQPLSYAIVSKDPMRKKVFALLAWAAYLPDYTCTEEFQPAAYIILLRDETKTKACMYDLGAASTTIMLAAEELGLASCVLAAFDPKKMKPVLELEDHLHPDLVIALGYAAHESNAVPFDGSIKYYRDENGNFCVPKKSLSDVLVYTDVD